MPAGLTAMQALDRKLEGDDALRRPVSCSRSTASQGSLTQQRDWFYFVNGVEGDRSAAEVTLHAGDVEWWDYRALDAARR